MPYYAVARGRQTGIYKTWEECKEQINNYGRSQYKKFDNEADAQEFVRTKGLCVVIGPDKGDQPKVTDTGDCLVVENSSPEENKLMPLLPRINTVEQQLTSALSELKSIKEFILGFNAPSYTRPEFVPKRKLSTNSCSGKPPKRNKPDVVDGSGFKYDAEGFVEVYTDGACENNGKANAKAGFGVFFGEGHPLNTAEPVSGRPTNNCGEIQAAIKAIKLAKSAGVSKICIYTDSQFVINAMTQWVKGWKKKGWKLADGNPVKNKVDFEELDREVKDMTVKWTYVKAHCGIFGNEMADALARQGAERYVQQS